MAQSDFSAEFNLYAGLLQRGIDSSGDPNKSSLVRYARWVDAQTLGLIVLS